MAFEEDVLDIALLTITDLSALQYHFVTLSADNTVEACNNAADVVVGVLQNKPHGETTKPAVARVRVFGVSRIVPDGAAGLAVATFVGPNATGEGVAKVADKDRHSGLCIVAGTAASTYATMVVMPPHTVEAS